MTKRRPKKSAPDDRLAFPTTGANSQDERARLLDAYRPYLRRIARLHGRSWLRQKEGDSDMVQESLVEAQRDFAQCKATDEVGLRLWLRGILLHNIQDMRKKYLDAQLRDVARERPLDDREIAPDLLRAAIARSDPPSRAAMEEEQREGVNGTLARLKPEYREALLLHYVDGLTFEELGELIGKSRQAAERLTKRAVKHFAQTYGKTEP